MVEQRAEVVGRSPRPYPTSELDRAAGVDSPEASDQERLAAKLRLVVSDPQLAIEVAGGLRFPVLILGPMTDSGKLTKEQEQTILDVQRTAVRSMFTAEELKRMDAQASLTSKDHNSHSSMFDDHDD